MLFLGFNTNCEHDIINKIVDNIYSELYLI